MVLGTLLSLASILAMLAYILKSKGYSPVGPYDAWRLVTAPIREANPNIPPLVAILGWFVGIWFADVFGSLWLSFALFIFLPAALAWEVLRVGIPTAIGAGAGFVTGFTDDVMPDRDNFSLPLTVYESEASDVSQWTDGAMHIPRRSLLTIGASGAGKSETLKHFVEQLQNDPSEPVVVFDMKRDYRTFLESRGVEMVRISSDSYADARWNVFREIVDESDADEIGRAIFPSGKDEDFFDRAGRRLFISVLKFLHREMADPTNADLVRYFETTDAETMHADLSGHEDLVASASAINPDSGKQAAGVHASATQTVADVFTGAFGEAGSFSVREYMQDPQGRVLVLDYPSRQAQTVAPLYRQLLDSAIMHGMADPSRGAYFLLDEIEHMDVPLKRLGELINVGRGNQCQAIISLQSVAQLQDTYGKERASALLSGMTSSIILRVADDASVEFARSVIGTHFEEYTGHVEREQIGSASITTSKEMRPSEEHDFAKGEFYRFDPGEAVIARQGEGWVHGRIQMLE